jgi:D-beta-D-heptose 7-phosphate kinase/D-beta-D-heptose 1-phosphate adenosyltransferase
VELRRLERFLDGFAGLRILVVGDVMLDEYLWGEVERVSPEAPVPVVHVQRESLALGGAGNVVRNVVALGAECVMCAAVGDDAAGDRIVDLLAYLGVDGGGVVRVEGRPTTRKTRVEARSQQIVRFDRETDAPLPAAAFRRLLRALDAALPGVDGVIVEDYDKGVLSPAFARAAMRRFRDAGVPVALDPKQHLTPYRGAALVKPNVREVGELAGRRVRTREELCRAVALLRRRLGGSAFVVTRGAEGMTIFDSDPAGTDVPIAQSEVFDVQGAGDTAIAALTLARLAGASLLEAAVIANAAAAVVVAKVGTATASPEELRARLPGALAAARPKRAAAARRRRAARRPSGRRR